MTALTTDNLADLIDKRCRCLQQLRDLGLKQADYIAAGEMTPLLRLISVKNQLIAALQTIERELTPYHAQDPEQRIWPTQEARKRCAEQAEICGLLLEEVMQLERQNEENMVQRRDKVATQLQAAQAANAARGAYQEHQMNTPQGPHSKSNMPAVSLSTSETQRLDLHSDV